MRPDLDRRWRPRKTAGPSCGYTFDGASCPKRGSHYCGPRADRVVAFFAELLVHTKGAWARRPFILDDWQEWEIVRPLFGEVIWSAEWERYVRRYRVAGVVVARKNGKSELAAGIALYMLVGDDEEAAEVYGAAKDTKQAGKVWEPAWRMVQLSPVLSKRLTVNRQARRIIDEKSASYYEIITADAAGELGANPHTFLLDEVLSQPDGSLWDAMRTAAGTRVQPLNLLITTETNEPDSFGAAMIDELERVQADPKRAPHVFAFVRKTPATADPFDESVWSTPNPALGRFLTVSSLREEALEARNDPARENAFRQFRLNQRVQATTRWLSQARWDASAQMVVEERLVGRPCFGGVSIARTAGIGAVVWDFPGESAHEVVWRLFVPQASVASLDEVTAGRASQWVREGRLRATDGDWLDYAAIHRQIREDARRFEVVSIGWNSRGGTQLAQDLVAEDFDVVEMAPGLRLASPLQELERLVLAGAYHHGGNPVVRWMVDGLVVRQDADGNVWPDQGKSRTPVSAVIAALLALDRSMRHEAEPEQETGYVIYEERVQIGHNL